MMKKPTKSGYGNSVYSFHFKILTSIKGHNSVANLRKMKLYNPNIDLINDNVHTKYG